ncbi:MAG TPA: SxtJ family membrane protein [Albitalea sp.]|nr:SxtJ family membrane protein [Albitalea sp.]
MEGSSDRTFGLVFAAFFIVVALLPLLRHAPARTWAVLLAVAFAALALIKPVLLAPLNRAWMRLGLLIGKVVSPIALGIVFFGVLTPTAALMRWRGQDPLRLRRAPGDKSYWQPRTPPGPPPRSMTNQF